MQMLSPIFAEIHIFLWSKSRRGFGICIRQEGFIGNRRKILISGMKSYFFHKENACLFMLIERKFFFYPNKWVTLYISDNLIIKTLDGSRSKQNIFCSVYILSILSAFIFLFCRTKFFLHFTVPHRHLIISKSEGIQITKGVERTKRI